jgi:aminodeoxyfutalosine deaminase
MFKLSSTQLFDGYRMHDDNRIIIFDDNGVITDIVNKEDAGDDVYTTNKLVTPGLVNVHCHLELSHYKGTIQPKTGLVGFLEAVIQARAKHANTPQLVVEEAMQQAEQAMIADGIVAVGDICNTANSASMKATSTLFYKNFIEALGFVPDMAAEKYSELLKIQRAFNQQHVTASLAPHAAYSVSKLLLTLVNYNNTDQTITVHNQESVAEHDFFMHKTGPFIDFYKNTLRTDIDFMDPIGTSTMQYLLKIFTKPKAVIWVHNTFTTASDIALVPHGLQRHYFCLCPNANLYIENTLPDVPMLLASQFPLVIGTDSLASNDTLSIQNEVQTLKKNFLKIDEKVWYKAATVNGARALGIEAWAGSFEIGKKPGWVAWNN